MAIVPGFLSVMLLATAKAVVRVAKTIANRRAARDLANWDAVSLKDIGLTQSDVQGALAMPFHRDPTYYLAHVAAGRSPLLRQSGAGAAGTSRPVEARKDRPGDLPSTGPALCA